MSLSVTEVLARVEAVLEKAIGADLPNYQIRGEFRKLKEEILAELHKVEPEAVHAAESAGEAAAGAAVEQIEKSPLLQQVESIKSNKDADALLAELNLVYPSGVTKLADKVDFLKAEVEKLETDTGAESADEPATA